MVDKRENVVTMKPNHFAGQQNALGPFCSTLSKIYERKRELERVKGRESQSKIEIQCKKQVKDRVREKDKDRIRERNKERERERSERKRERKSKQEI